MTKSVKKSLNKWSEENKINLQKRLDNLEQEKDSLNQDEMNKIVAVVNSIQNINFDNQDLKNNFSKLEEAIQARITKSEI